MPTSAHTSTTDPAAAAAGWVELDAGLLGGAELKLLWRPTDGAVALAVADLGGGWCGRRIPPARAADAWRRPLAYLDPRPAAAARQQADDGFPRAAGVDVDELWLSELAEDALAGLSELLRLQDEEGRRGDRGV
jgi:hypothetical protein